MHLEVSFRNLAPRDEVRQRAQALYKKLERFLDPATDAQMVVGIEHGVAIVDTTLISRGTTFKVTEEDPDLRTALDRGMHALENQLRRAKEKRTSRKGRGENGEEFAAAADVHEADEEPSLV